MLLTVSSDVTPARIYTLGGLKAGLEYSVRVTAHNSAGATPALYTVNTAFSGPQGTSFWPARYSIWPSLDHKVHSVHK